jgi:hypothetical protein
MARPTKEGLDYFPHDTDAVNDEKLEALRALHGNDGYAFFFILLERIYRSPKCELIVSDAETIQILARKVAVTEQKFNEMLTTALKWGCFNKQIYEKYGILTSNGVKKRSSMVLEKRDLMKELYQKTKLKSSFLPVSDAETPPETPPETPQSKVKKSKVKEKKSKVKKKKTPSPSFEEYQQELKERFKELDIDVELEKFNLYWSEGKRKLKNPKLALLNWLTKAREYKTKDTVSPKEGTVCDCEDNKPILYIPLHNNMTELAEEVWNHTLLELKDKTAKANYVTWLKDTKGVSYKEPEFVVEVPTIFVADWLRNRLGSLITKTLLSVTTWTTVKVYFRVKEYLDDS